LRQKESTRNPLHDTSFSTSITHTYNTPTQHLNTPLTPQPPFHLAFVLDSEAVQLVEPVRNGLPVPAQRQVQGVVQGGVVVVPIVVVVRPPFAALVVFTSCFFFFLSQLSAKLLCKKKAQRKACDIRGIAQKQKK